jgi:sulfite exporter TauE/SafE
MLAFGLGTSGALVVTGVFSGTVAGFLGRWTARLPAVAVVMTGFFLLWRGMMAVAPAAPKCH